MNINLSSVVQDWLNSRPISEAVEEISNIAGKKYSENTVKNWASGKFDPPLKVAQYVLSQTEAQVGEPDSESPSPKGDVDPFKGAKVYMGMPIYQNVTAYTFKAWSVLKHIHGDNLGQMIEVDTEVHVARDRIVKRFLESDGEYLFFLDSDMAPPIGFPTETAKWGAKYNSAFAERDVISQLIAHEQTLVSALYFDRYGQGVPMYREGRNDEKEAEYARSGPHRKLKATDWTGAGCLMIHRSVFDAIYDKVPSIRSDTSDKPHGFFTPMVNMGEDVSFCTRAKECGHQPYVDLGCMCGHFGGMVFWNEKFR